VKRKLKTFSLVVMFVGLLVGLLNLRGCLVDSEKVRFAVLVEKSDEELPRSTPGFTKFLRAFSPPSGFVAESITALATYRLQSPEGYNVFGNVSYVVGAQHSTPVATFEQIRTWSVNTYYGAISWFITVTGFLISVVVEYNDRAEQRKAA
jgi:hypothetical protein